MLENILAVLQMVKLYDSNFTARLMPKRNQNLFQQNLQWIFTEVLLIIDKKWKQAKYLSTNARINTTWYIHITEYYLTTKRNEAVIHATTWVNHKNIILSEKPSHKEPHVI